MSQKRKKIKPPKSKSKHSQHKKSKNQHKSQKPKEKRPEIVTLKAPDGKFWIDHKWQALIIFLLPFLLYQATYQYGYILDDKVVISENNYVQKGLEGMWDIFANDSFSGFLGEQKDLVVGARYRPLSLATFAIEHEIYGLKPGISHFINILLYALSGLLIFRLVHLMAPEKKNNQTFIGLAFLSALFFVFHPVHTEAVANIKGRDEVLTLLLSLGTIYFCYRYLFTNKILPLILSAIIFMLAILAKENAITFLAVIPLTFYLFTEVSIKKIGTITGVLLGVSIAYLLIRQNVIGYLLNTDLQVSSIMNDPFLGTSTSEKLATIMYTLGKYIQLLVFPHPLTHDYYPYHIPIINWGDWRALVSLALYGGLGFIAIKYFKKSPVISWGILFYLVTLSIVSNIVFPVGSFMNERFIYVSSLGFCLILAYLIIDKIPAWFKLSPQKAQILSLAIAGIFLIGYGFKTMTRIPAWKDPMTLNRAAVKVSVNSARANSFMAYSLYKAANASTDQNEKKSLLEEAVPYVNKALQVYPQYTDALNCKAGVMAGLYQIDRDLDKLLNEFYGVLSVKHMGFIDQYMEYLNPRADKQKLRDFYYKAGYQLMGQTQKSYALAVKYLGYGLKVSPNDLIFLEALSDIYFQAGNKNQAKAFAEQALRVNPNSVKAKNILRQVLP